MRARMPALPAKDIALLAIHTFAKCSKLYDLMSIKVCPNCSKPHMAEAATAACPNCGRPTEPYSWNQESPANLGCLILLVIFAFLLMLLPLLLFGAIIFR